MSSKPYPNAPVALVACEVRFPVAEADARQARELRAALREVLPIAKVESVQQIEVIGGTKPDIRAVQMTRLLSRDRTSCASIWPDKVVIETTSYPGYTEFRKLIEVVVLATESTLAPAGLERVGLRFIDEVRPPVQPVGLEWGDWVAAELIGPAALPVPGGLPEGWQGAVQFQTAPGTSVVLRYGPRDGYAVSPDGVLRRPDAPPNTPCFVFDFDSFWAATDEVPEFESSDVMVRCDELHQPQTEMFEQLVTDRLRSHMRGEEK